MAPVDCLRGKKEKLYSETLLVCVKFLYMLCLNTEKREPGFHRICGFQQGHLERCKLKYKTATITAEMDKN